MKQYITIIISCILAAQIQAEAQVGINTKNPAGVFHIHPQQNSPTTTDDVIFTNQGYLGLGTITPTNQVHINVPSTTSPMRIVDGYQAADRVIVSDADGNGGWSTMRASGGSKFVLPATRYAKGVITKLNLNGSTSYKVSSNGNYLFFIRWWGKADALTARATANVYFFLYRNGTVVDIIEYYVPVGSVNTYFSFTVALAGVSCKKGDTLELAVRPQNSNFTTGSGSYLPCTVTLFVM